MSGHQPAGGGGVQAEVHVRGRAQPPHRVPHQQTLPVITRREHLATTTDQLLLLLHCWQFSHGIQFTNGRRNKTESDTNYFKPTLETTQTWPFDNDMIDEFKVIRSITFCQCFVSIINYFGMFPCVLRSWDGNEFSSGGIITVQCSERLKCV